jgi:hypothetical protein
VSVGLNQEQNFSRDAALIALAHARDQIAGSNNRPLPDKLGRGGDGSKVPGDITSPSTINADPVTLSEDSARGGRSIWGLLVGLEALVPVGIIVLAWHFLTRPADESHFSTSSIPKELAAKAPSLGTAAADANAVASKSPQAEPPSIASARPELAQSMASMIHQLADSELEVDKLKAQQTQMLQENSVLDKHLRETQELAHKSANQINDLKSAQSQIAQDKDNLAAQLKASQEQVTTLAAQLDASQAQMAKIAAQIKASQDQIARLVEQRQKQRSKPLVAASPPASGLTNGLAPKPPLQQARPQTQNPAAGIDQISR